MSEHENEAGEQRAESPADLPLPGPPAEPEAEEPPKAAARRASLLGNIAAILKRSK